MCPDTVVFVLLIADEFAKIAFSFVPIFPILTAVSSAVPNCIVPVNAGFAELALRAIASVLDSI